jgi:carboxylesterase type B
MIFGSNSDEGGIFTLGTYFTPIISPANYSAFLTANFGRAASLVASQYNLSLPAFNSTKAPEFAAINTIITQAQFLCPAYQAMLKAQINNIPVYTYLNSHTPSCQWSSTLNASLIPFVGATHTSKIPYVFGNGVGLPLPGGNCNFTVQENTISENLIAAWSAMASTGNPSVEGGLEWPEWNNNTSLGVNIVNATSVGVVDYSPCAFWDMIDTLYLNFTSSSDTGASGNGSTGSGTGTKNGAEREIEIAAWALTMAVGIVASLLLP